VQATRYLDDKGQIRYGALESPQKKKPKRAPQKKRETESLERDLLSFILKYHNFCQSRSSTGDVIRNSGKPMDFPEKKTDEQYAQAKQIKMLIESLQSDNLFGKFESQLRQTDTGEFQIDLNQCSEIERKTKADGLLNKYQPVNYGGSLK
jgi:hypothetical protein